MSETTTATVVLPEYSYEFARYEYEAHLRIMEGMRVCRSMVDLMDDDMYHNPMKNGATMTMRSLAMFAEHEAETLHAAAFQTDSGEPFATPLFDAAHRMGAIWASAEAAADAEFTKGLSAEIMASAVRLLVVEGLAGSEATVKALEARRGQRARPETSPAAVTAQ